jgi:hypothetical protein
MEQIRPSMRKTLNKVRSVVLKRSLDASYAGRAGNGVKGGK